MTFSQMVAFLKTKNLDKILFIKSCVFYMAVAQDAVFLSKLLSLKTVCYKNSICKIGIPENSLKKYLNKLDETGFGYVVYCFDKENKEINTEITKEGKIHNEFLMNAHVAHYPGERVQTKVEDGLKSIIISQ